MEKLKSLLFDIQTKKFKTRNGGTLFHNLNLIRNDSRYEFTKNKLQELYYVDGLGVKSIIKTYDLPISYSVLRFMFLYLFNFKLRKNNEITDHLRLVRREKALNESKNKIGFFGGTIQEDIKIKNNPKTCYSGYYFNVGTQKYVWLRSSWEYIYAKWLDEHNLIWDVECTTFLIDNKIRYRPDFFIFNQNKLVSIVEIKGYWKDKLWKVNKLKEMLMPDGIQVVFVDVIKPYTTSYNNDLKKWKKERILNL